MRCGWKFLLAFPRTWRFGVDPNGETVHIFIPLTPSERLRKTRAHIVASEGIQLRICRPTSMKYADY